MLTALLLGNGSVEPLFLPHFEDLCGIAIENLEKLLQLGIYR